MGLLRWFLGFFDRDQSEATNPHQISYYPVDHKLTGQERKECTHSFLRKMRIPFLEQLPLVVDHTVASFRNEKDVAGKAVVLYGLIHVAHGARSSNEMMTYFTKYDLWKHVSTEEREYLEKKTRTSEEDNGITWRIENLNVLLWALGNFETLSLPVNTCDLTKYKTLPGPDADPTGWIRDAKLRNKEEILNETDRVYRMHWATREATLKGKPGPAGLSDDIVMERHFALNWLTMYADDWDDIRTDT